MNTTPDAPHPARSISLRQPEPCRWAILSFVVVLVATTLLGPATPAARGKMLVWTDDTMRIQRADTDGNNVQTVLNLPFRARRITADEVHRQLYWISDDDFIRRTNYDGTGLENVAQYFHLNSDTEFGSPKSLALDVLGTGTGGVPKMYVGEISAFDFKRSNLDGSNVETFITGLGNDVYQLGVALNLRDDLIYWSMCCADNAAPVGILRANLDGSNVETILQEGFHVGVGQPEDIALDLIHNKVYWIDSRSGPNDWSIRRADLDGANLEVIVPVINELSETLALDPAEDRIYWGDEGSIWGANLDGSNVTELIPNTGKVYGITLIPEPSSSVLLLAALLVCAAAGVRRVAKR